jgi:hypothetical protein
VWQQATLRVLIYFQKPGKVTSVKLVWNRGVVEQPIDTFAPVEKPMQLA